MSMTEIKAIIFDMDGVISDTQKLHALVEEEILRRYGVNLSPEEITQKYAGTTDREFFEKIFNDHNISVDVENIIKEKWERMIKISKNNISPISGAVELIKNLRRNDFKLAIASASPHNFIKLVLEELNLKGKFDVIVSAEDVKFGKPNPEIFLLAVKKLRVKPEECIIIEDGINGIIAGKKAGMKCIWFTKEENKTKVPADLIVNDLKELTIAKIKGL